MTSGESEWDDDFQLDELISRFDEMVRNGGDGYFDSEEFEELYSFFTETQKQEKARLVLEKALKLHRNNYRIKLLWAKQLADDGHLSKAIKVLDDIENEEPEDSDIYLMKGAVYNMMLNFAKSVEEYEKALMLADEDEMEELYVTIALQYENLGEFDKALSYLQKAMEYTESPDQILSEIGLCFEMAERIEDGITFFQQYLEKNPTNHAAWFNLGLAFYHLQLYEKAIDAMEYALSIEESYLPAIINIGQLYSTLGNYHKALEYFHESEQYEEADSLTLYYMGECHEKMLDFEEALLFYRKAIAKDEYFADAWAGMGVIYDEKGETRKAIHYLEKAIELDSFNNEFHLIIADLFIKIKRFDKAREHYQVVEENDPFDPDLWKDYAYMHIASGEIEKAVQILKTGLIHQPNNPGLLYRLVAALMLNKKPDQAYEYLELALSIDFEGHTDLYDFMPALKDNPRVTELILQFAP
ncbi:MAG: tetratricopeptide repeat protein [Bacteroidales bacterium]|nr:tetratricopeptide repeat protein [Bacteroidales bacterium]